MFDDDLDVQDHGLQAEGVAPIPNLAREWACPGPLGITRHAHALLRLPHASRVNARDGCQYLIDVDHR